MVLDVSRGVDPRRERRCATELGEDRFQGLVEHIGEHVQPATVGHGQQDLLETERAAALDDLLDGRDHGFAAFQTEALGAGKAAGQVPLERLGVRQTFENRAFPEIREIGTRVLVLDPALNPGLPVGILNVHELHADRPGVGFLQDSHDLAKGGPLEAQHVIDEDRPVVVRRREAVGGRVQFRVRRHRREPERIQVRLEVAPDAERPDEHQGANRIPRALQHRRRGGAHGQCACGRIRVFQPVHRRGGQGVEETAPGRINRFGVGGKGCIETPEFFLACT